MKQNVDFLRRGRNAKILEKKKPQHPTGRGETLNISVQVQDKRTLSVIMIRGSTNSHHNHQNNTNQSKTSHH